MEIYYLADRPAHAATLAQWHYRNGAVLSMEIRPNLTPWMVDVFVAPEFRRRGIASALVKRVVREAVELSVAQLYLYTTGAMREKLYADLGWKVLERPIYLGVARVVMSIVPR